MSSFKFGGGKKSVASRAAAFQGAGQKEASKSERKGTTKDTAVDSGSRALRFTPGSSSASSGAGGPALKFATGEAIAVGRIGPAELVGAKFITNLRIPIMCSTESARASERASERERRLVGWSTVLSVPSR